MPNKYREEGYDVRFMIPTIAMAGSALMGNQGPIPAVLIVLERSLVLGPSCSPCEQQGDF